MKVVKFLPHGFQGILPIKQRGCRCLAHAEEEFGLNESDLLVENRSVRFHFACKRVPIVRRAALQNVGYVDFFACEADGLQYLVQQHAGPPHERFSLGIFVRSRRFSDDHEVRIRISGAEHRVFAGFIQWNEHIVRTNASTSSSVFISCSGDSAGMSA